MKNKEIIIFVAVVVYAAVRLYMRYGKKEKNNSDSTSKTNMDSRFNSSSKEDEYEPYSKK